ncbi:protocatechuate 3,4-dioxygenase [Streptomyces rimosus]|nr:protocatechuate 3,4-dioxygenase [Streptomyces rimosus]KUJ39871.1 protocatechuate 3,4-dioxygenase subunit beta [Streptomyces rimosus subsp. rimosus]KEF17282.1 protocatechuate 3,4-dioxygenase [Streptomyces rimosus]UNZ05949.1 Protocatechuate 3,4-dioxygenase beta chain [Streptomyces rimosus subsp. rimosus]UTH97405.1 Protocatechuate 3,4-dioxygenase beta chain [Streptomyces rimosus subsp. rimosus]
MPSSTPASAPAAASAIPAAVSSPTPYRGFPLRHPALPPVSLSPDPESAELYGPVFGDTDVTPLDSDLTQQHRGTPIGERITVTGRLLNDRGRPIPHQLIELWQANAAGRYAHRGDQHDAPLDPNFTGTGRALTDAAGRYAFTTIKPGPYPLGTPDDAWRAAHLHFSLFGRAFTQRLVTQMYFEGDPLLAHDSVLHAAPTAAARHRLIATYAPGPLLPGRPSSLTYHWDIVLGGPAPTAAPA